LSKIEYTSSLTDNEWLIIEPLLPQKKKTRPPKWIKRDIVNGIFYQLKNGCNWVDLPRDLPPYSTVFWYYKQWREAGIIEKIMHELHGKVREQVQKKPLWTTLIMVDSQATKNTCNAEKESSGFCFYKATNGIKRHLAVDSLGFPFFTHCTKANISDDQGLIEMFTNNIDYFKSKPLDIPMITILVDDGYHPMMIMIELEKVYPEIATKIKFEQSPKISKVEKIQQGITGFVPVKMRWVVERSNAWVERCKILVKNYERTLLNAVAKLNLCFVRLMLIRLAENE
jgi:transposase